MKCNKIVSGLQSLAQLEAMSRFIAETSKEEEADAPSEHEHCGEQMVVVAEGARGVGPLVHNGVVEHRGGGVPQRGEGLERVAPRARLDLAERVRRVRDALGGEHEKIVSVPGVSHVGPGLRHACVQQDVLVARQVENGPV